MDYYAAIKNSVFNWKDKLMKVVTLERVMVMVVMVVTVVESIWSETS